MTKLRTVDEVALSLSNKGYGSTDLARIVDTVKADRLSISNALVEALEGKKKEVLTSPEEETGEGYGIRLTAHNQALTEAQNIIRTLLESKN